MKAYLMFENDDFNNRKKFPAHGHVLIQDLSLNTLLSAMAAGDDFILKISREALLSGIYNNLETILYRQQLLKDCLNYPQIIREMYRIATEAILVKNKHWWILSSSPSSILYSSIATLKELLIFLQQLRSIADKHIQNFGSEGFKRFFGMLQEELNNTFFENAQQHLSELQFHNGMWLNARLGNGKNGSSYQLRKQPDKRKDWKIWNNSKKTKAYTFNIHPRDESGIRALREINDAGVNAVASILAQSVDHVINFFQMLQTELAFYVGCLNLHEQLNALGEPYVFPVPLETSQRNHTFKGLYDICLALTLQKKVVGNDLSAENKTLFIITGANKGGKSTFLRSIGIAQLMMQCGMFVPAEYFSANICDALFTHFKREEDTTMKSGKLDEELGRMNKIADNLTANTLILFNESFAATNEREGAEIGRQIVNALHEAGIKVFFVTHLYDFANSYYERKLPGAVFLRADRQPDGTRTFRLTENKPMPTSFARDLYEQLQ